VVSNIPGAGVDVPTDPILGCHCVGGCKANLEKGKCCPGGHKGRFAYRDGLIKLPPGRPIFECNSRCFDFCLTVSFFYSWKFVTVFMVNF